MNRRRLRRRRHLLLRNVNVCDGPLRRAPAAAQALALHGVRHAHGNHLALVEARVAGRLGVELVLHAPVEPPDALDCKC